MNDLPTTRAEVGDFPNHPPENPQPDCQLDALHARMKFPNDYPLDDILEGFYHHFGLSNYLDQIGIIDDRISNIVNQLEGWADTYGVEDSARDELFHIIASISNDGILGEEEPTA